MQGGQTGQFDRHGHLHFQDGRQDDGTPGWDVGEAYAKNRGGNDG